MRGGRSGFLTGLRRRVSGGSMLLGEPDRDLSRFDRALRRASAGGSADELRRLAEASAPSMPGGRSLALIYAAVAAWYRRDWDAAMTDLRSAIAATEVLFLRARALQILVYLLFMACDEERDSDQTAQAEAHERECRDLCERGFKEFGVFEWSAPVIGALETALGVLDYPKDRFTSRLHLVRALGMDGWARRDLEQFCPGCLGFARLYMGHHCLHDGDHATAARHYDEAARELSGDLALHASIHMLEALSRSGEFDRLKRAALRALRRAPAGARDGPQAVEMKRYLAQALIRTGDPGKAESILREIAAAPGDQAWKPAARRWLDERSSARRHRT